MKDKRDNQLKYALAAFLAVLIFVIIYKYSLNELGSEGIADLKDHAKHAADITLGTMWSSWLHRPYLFWHLCVSALFRFCGFPLEEASACINACFAVFCYYVTWYILERISCGKGRKNTANAAAFLAAMLSLVAPLRVWWFSHYQYEGQFSINPLFNPTHMAVKPFGLLTFMVAVDLILRYKGKETIFLKWRNRSLYIFFSVILLLSAFTKPTFMYMLLPAGVVYLLIDLGVALFRKDGSWRATWNFMWKIACASIPALAYLAFEYAAFYFWGGTNSDAKVAIYPFLTAWHIYSSDVPTSIILGMLFPIWMVVTNPGYFIQSVEGRLSFIGYVVGALEFSFFVETGDKLGHLNFSWPMMSGMLLLWVTAGARLVEMTYAAGSGKRSAISISLGWIFLAIHLFSGLYYINPYQYII